MFSPGDRVLVLLPLPGSTLQAQYSGPFEVERKVSDIDYLVKTPGRKRKTRLCHVNLLKPYFDRKDVFTDPKPVTVLASPEPRDAVCMFEKKALLRRSHLYQCVAS